MPGKRLAQWRPPTNGSCCFDYCSLFMPQTTLDLVTKRSGGPHAEVKVDKDRQMVVLEEEFQNISPEELKTELPERQPRFVVYSYKYVHEDGRVSYPLCFIFSSPVGCKPEQQMMYAGSKNRLVQTAELTKVFEIRTTEDLTEAWLQEKLSFFR
ncbi:glia maturation factor gamma isoform X1 [Vulpes vulpes]|uniref:Glia maturation factor gamma isoform X1 n=1 Tax=Vulpes vulpes TaxID=9627 RepID=A0A3Q7UEK4_VULVU|nr:glia maturation factor gamma isoform X1 [Vulpes vulpes]XP_041586541.1 glia maturation factor gamma isoform X1 [Vulpes lagopus]